ncbi:MAG: LD-carboxypeptidase [Paucibacter sp.]|nr:LD-carboxypeptidase [Roseateles sp.]
MTTLTLFSPSGSLAQPAQLRRAAKRLAKLSFEVSIDEAALLKDQRFAGDDDTRLAAIHRVAKAVPSVALATRGGYGLSRLMDRIDWKKLGKSVEKGTRWVGMSDFTALQLGLLTHAKATTWSGPVAYDDFGRSDAEGGVDDVTRDCFVEAMDGLLEAVGFRTDAGFDGLGVRGQLWGGNLCMVCSLLGTAHFPKIKGGVLFLEDVAEQPFRVERMLMQLHMAGVLDRQKAIVLGEFSQWRRTEADRGYELKHTIAKLRSLTKTPVLTGLPFGHITTKVSLPVGAKVELLVQGRDAFIAWQHDHAHSH